MPANRMLLPVSAPTELTTRPPDASATSRTSLWPRNALPADSASTVIARIGRRTGAARAGGDEGVRVGTAVGMAVGKPGGAVGGWADGAGVGPGSSGGWLTAAGIGTPGSARPRLAQNGDNAAASTPSRATTPTTT